LKHIHKELIYQSTELFTYDYGLLLTILLVTNLLVLSSAENKLFIAIWSGHLRPSDSLGFSFYTSCFFLEFLCPRSIFYSFLALLVTCPIQTVYPINQVFLLQLAFPSHSISSLMSTHFSLIGYLTIKAT